MTNASTWVRVGLVALTMAITILIALGCDDSGRAPRPPAGPATYVGSRVCAECHDRLHADWQTTPHARAVREIEAGQPLAHGDFAAPVYAEHGLALDFALADLRLVHGSNVRQVYVDPQWRIRALQWSFADRRWHRAGTTDWAKSDWRRECAACHSVGYDPAASSWRELGVGCEACHGPGSHHVEASGFARAGTIRNPAKMPPAAADAVCGQCHTRGVTDAAHPYPHPVGFRPGEALGSEHYTPVPRDDPRHWWPSGAARSYRQQFLEWQSSPHADAGVACTTCHDVHQSHRRAAAQRSSNSHCIACHPRVSTDSQRGHAPIAGAPQHSDCVGCHFPTTVSHALPWDSHSHAGYIPPRATLELGGGDVNAQPNSCNLCHHHRDLGKPGNQPAALQRALDEGRARLREGK